MHLHDKNKNSITVVASDYNLEIPFGVIINKGNSMKSIIEKPNYNFLINCGIYIIDSKIKKYIKNNERINMDELFKKGIKKNNRIGLYPLTEDVLDYGSHKNLKIAKRILINYFMPKIPFFIPSITNQDINAVKNTLKKKWISQGKISNRFEKKFAEKLRTKPNKCVGVTNGFSALYLASILCKLKKNDEVLIPSVNFVASANIFSNLKAKVVFIDCESHENPNISISDLKKNYPKNQDCCNYALWWVSL